MRGTDADVGISQFLGSHAPFTAIVKAHVSDFVVNEVTRDGNLVELTSTSLPEVSPAKNQSGDNGGGAHLKPPGNDDEWITACQELDKIIGHGPCDAGEASVSESIRAFATSNHTRPKETNSNGKRVGQDLGDASSRGPETPGAAASLVLPAIPEKATRKSVHAWVSQVLPDYITDTITVGTETTHIRLRRKDECRPWKRKRTESGLRGGETATEGNQDAVLSNTYDPREVSLRGGARGRGRGGGGRERNPHYVDRRSYVQFVLWKQGRDTMNALSELARRLRLKPDDLSHAGTKDKRGITTQRIRVRGIPLGKLVQVNRSFGAYQGAQRMAIGNYQILPKEVGKLGLGDLGGNRFTLALRDLDLRDPAATPNIMDAVKSVREHGFINYFGLQRFGSGAFGTHVVGFSVMRGNFAEACTRILTPLVIQVVAEGKEELREDRRSTDEALREFAKGTISAKDLLAKLPRWMNVERNVVSGFAHDEERKAKHDPKAAFSKVPRTMKKMYGHAVQSFIWNRMASVRIRESRTKYAIEGDLVLSEDQDAGIPRADDGKPLESGRERRRMVSLSASTKVRAVSAEEASRQSISVDEVLIPMLGSQVPIPDTTAGKAAREILEKEKVDLQQLPQDYDMNGTYRWLIARPSDVTAKIVSYNDRKERIIASKVDDVLALSNQRGQSRGLRGGPPCAPEESKGVNEKEKSIDASDEVAEHGGIDDASGPRGSFSALVLTFTLSVAEYATILIRELTKQDSSIDNQKLQQQRALDRDEQKGEARTAPDGTTVNAQEGTIANQQLPAAELGPVETAVVANSTLAPSATAPCLE